jgi:hypothetical protein
MKCKSLAGVIVALGALASLHPAYAWDWYHTPMRIQNDTSSTWTHIHNDAGWYAKIEPMDGKFPDSVAPGQSLNTLATWRYACNGWDNDNAAELFFTVDGIEHSLQIKGHHVDLTLSPYTQMYIRFYQNSNGISDDVFCLQRVAFYSDIYQDENYAIRDGYQVSESSKVGEYDDIHVADK